MALSSEQARQTKNVFHIALSYENEHVMRQQKYE